MDVQKQDLHNLVKEIIPDIYIEDEEEFNQNIDAWYDDQERYREMDKRRIQMVEKPKEEVVILSDYIIDKELYLELNEGMDYKKCMLQLQASQLKYMGDLKKTYSITRNMHSCFQLIMKELGAEKENPYQTKDGYFYFEARKNVMPSEDGKVRYSISDGDEQQKVNLICDLLEIW